MLRSNESIKDMADKEIEKSPNDSRDYSLIKLNNGLRALLVSDIKIEDPDDDEMEESSCSESESESDNASDGDDADTNTDDDEGSDMDASDGSSHGGPIRSRATSRPPSPGRRESGRNSAANRHNEDFMIASACLCVHAGGFLDPPDIQGLAHYLEHMVFMGCEKFSGANEFDIFVKMHGGATNARTDLDYTSFYFQIDSNYLQEALERFSEFFISPLFKEEYMQSELEIIDREFNEARLRDRNRLECLMTYMAKEGHPMRSFAWGNAVSLRDSLEGKNINVRERIRSFFRQYYVAENMTLCVLSNDPIDKIQEMVVKFFSRIRRSSSSTPLPDYSDLGAPFDTPEFSRLYRVIPAKNIRQLQLSWALPSLMPYYRNLIAHSKGSLAEDENNNEMVIYAKCRPDTFVSHVLGHEGPGSLYALLKDRGLAVHIQAGIREGPNDQEHNKFWTCFHVLITLTSLGLDYIDEIVKCVFQCVRMMRDVGPREDSYLEQSFVDISSFRYIEPTDTADYVTHLAQNLWKYQTKDIITAHYIHQLEYDAKRTRWLIDQLTPDKVNLIVMSQHYKDICALTEKWFGTKYAVEDIPEKLRQEWRNCGRCAAMRYPPKNAYIATNFEMFNENVKMPKPKLSQPLRPSQCIELWYHMDERLNVPRAFACFYIKSVHSSRTAVNKLMSQMYSRIIQYNLIEVCYAAEIARLGHSIQCMDHGIGLRVHGFSHKLPVLFEDIIAGIQTCRGRITQAQLDSVKEELNDVYQNFVASPKRLNKDLYLAILQGDYFSAIDLRNALPNVTLEKLTGFIGEFYKGVHVEALVEGNMTGEDAGNMTRLLEQKLCITCPTEANLHLINIIKIPCGNHVCRVRNVNPTDSTSVVHNYYQHDGIATLKDRMILEFLVMVMEEPCFNILRTKHKLGYTVSVDRRSIHNIIGFSVTVYSTATRFTCQHIDNCIEEFLKDFNKDLQKMKPRTFETAMETLENLVSSADTNITEEVTRHWREIVKHTYKFNGADDELDVLKTITLDDVKMWSKEHLLPSSTRRKLSVQVVGNDPKAKTEQNTANCSDGTNYSLQFLPVNDANAVSIVDVHAFHTACEHYQVNVFAGASQTASTGDGAQDSGENEESNDDDEL